MILILSASSDGLWSFVNCIKFLPPFYDKVALESPVFAIHTSLSIISITMAQEPDLSLICKRFYLMKVSSASLKPLNRAFSGFRGKLGWLAIILWRLSRRNSAHPWPPCPSKTAKNEACLIPGANYSSGLLPGFFKSRTIDILSSL